LLKRLIQKCTSNNRKAQNELYHVYTPTMLSVCLRYTNSKEEAEEVLMNGLVKVYAKLNMQKHELSREDHYS